MAGLSRHLALLRDVSQDGRNPRRTPKLRMAMASRASLRSPTRTGRWPTRRAAGAARPRPRAMSPASGRASHVGMAGSRGGATLRGRRSVAPHRRGPLSSSRARYLCVGDEHESRGPEAEWRTAFAAGEALPGDVAMTEADALFDTVSTEKEREDASPRSSSSGAAPCARLQHPRQTRSENPHRGRRRRPPTRIGVTPQACRGTNLPRNSVSFQMPGLRRERILTGR